MAKDLKAFLTKMNEDATFAEEVKAKGKSITETEKISDEKELAVKVGKELGYEFTMGDIERLIAEDQELDDKELAKAAGGLVIGARWCWWQSYNCVFATTPLPHSDDRDDVMYYM
jgi:predicted ribosomally synthesized peptide with nif11-like leader